MAAGKSFARTCRLDEAAAASVFAGTVTVDNQLCAKRSDGTRVCASNDQLAALLSGASGGNQSPASAQPGSSDTSTLSASVTHLGAASTTPPTITITIPVGDTYADLGATITGPTTDLNLGIMTFLIGRLVSNIVLDTSRQATDTIDYVATDSAGQTCTRTNRGFSAVGVSYDRWRSDRSMAARGRAGEGGRGEQGIRVFRRWC
jgi:hypothetical protein